MRILFDLTATQPDNKIKNHGGSEYAKAAFFRLVELHPEAIFVLYNKDKDLDNSIFGVVKRNNLKYPGHIDPDSIGKFINENGINVFYSALPSESHFPILAMQSEKFKVIITIHGLRPLELLTDTFEWQYCKTIKSRLKFIYKRIFPGQYRNSLLNHYKKLFTADKIVTVSEHSKKSILKFFPSLNRDKISVLYSPLLDYTDTDENSINILKDLNIISGEYLLMLSGSIWTKNSIRAIKAFDNLISEDTSFNRYKMVITGLVKSPVKIKNRGNFVFTDYLNRALVETILKNAHSLIYPSLNEGFGYPPLEAMKYGVPVLVSEIGPVLEVCAETAYYFNPLKICDIKRCIKSSFIDKDISTSPNKASRIRRYNMIKRRQDEDLNSLVSLIAGHSIAH